MNLLEVFILAGNYSIPTLIISIVVTVIMFFVRKFLLGKISAIYLSYIPFILGILLYILYAFLFLDSAFCFSNELIYSGLMCASLSTVGYMLTEKIKNNLSIKSISHIAVEGILKNIVDDSLMEQTIQNILDVVYDDDAITKITQILKSVTTNTTDTELKTLAFLIQQTVNSFKTR